VGAEALGSHDAALDAEAIVLLATLLSRAGVRDARLRLSSLGSSATRSAYREELKAYLRQHESQLTSEVRNRIDLNPLRAFDADDPRTREVMANAPRLLDRLDREDADHFAAVRALLDDAEVAYEVDGTLVRGLDYYTRTVFEFESDELGAQRGVAGGGRYDGLVEELGGPPTPGVGWAAGIERMLLAAHADAPPALPLDLFVALDGPDEGRAARGEAFALLLDARSAGLRADMELAGRSLKGQLRHADRLGARYVAIIGGGEPQLRDMRTASQESVARSELIARVVAGAGRTVS
jgi:histidyl-tRNA synthetase